MNSNMIIETEGAADGATGFSAAFGAEFGLSDAVIEALKNKGFTAPTPIQAISLPRLLADEGHLVVKARTGTGKTAAFGIPLVEKLTTGTHAPRALILTPTRELCQQICKEIASLTTRQFPRITAVYGGASIRNQIFELKRGTEIVAGTPGRVMDLMDRKALDLSAVDYFILDEADEMLDMGFFEDIETILKAVKPERRVGLFSATMPEPILKIVRDYIGEVEILEDAAPEDEKPAVDQFYLVVKKEDRLEALRRIIDAADDFYALVFCATKIGADELAHRLVENGYPAEAIHGDLSQEARERTLRRFRSKLTKILVATDVAARGLDIERLTHVINFDLPNDKEIYIHRIGRTGRAGRRGKAVSLALPSERQRIKFLSRNMERLLGSPIVFTKVPHVKAVMKAMKRRIVSSVIEAWATEADDLIQNIQNEDEPAKIVEQGVENAVAIAGEDSSVLAESAAPTDAAVATASATPAVSLLLSDPIAAISKELIEKLGAEKAVQALVTLSYGEQLEPSRYGAIMEFQEQSERAAPAHGVSHGGAYEKYDKKHSRHSAIRHDRRAPRFADGASRHANFATDFSVASGAVRVYVGLGRQHGASARDVAQLLSRAGNIAGRMVDGIEMKDFCAFATMPEGAALRAIDYSRKAQNEPIIKKALERG
ncbi:MAG: DEAD/DEAH box helicase [Treponema sp.]|jgi:ATP-dependent RNA helicase DeaD|nr:DEAD/DEAH box helicase [Treponema sp.]